MHPLDSLVICVKECARVIRSIVLAIGLRMFVLGQIVFVSAYAVVVFIFLGLVWTWGKLTSRNGP